MDTLKNIPDVSFIDDLSLEELQNQMIKDFQDKYKEITGDEIDLPQASPYRLILYACTLQQYQAMQYIETCGKMNLLKYAAGEFLDQLGALRGIKRKDGTKALTTIKFKMNEPRNSVTTIPKGVRLSVNNIYFKTTEQTEIPAGDSSIEVTAECTETGSVGNDYMPGEIYQIVDAVPYIDGAENTVKSDYGSDVEDDDSFAERIYLAPSGYSVAGPEDAYKYYVKECSPLITDVSVISPLPTYVEIRFVMEGGELPDENMLKLVSDYVNARDRRPLTDQVSVMAPDTIPYNINVKYFINESQKAVAISIQQQVEKAVEEYIGWQDTHIGKDINPSYLTHLMIKAGAKRVEIAEPIFTEVAQEKIPHVSGKEIVYGGIEDD